MKPKTKGIKVTVHLTLGGVTTIEVYRNVTEVHYKYKGFDGNNRVAFESDIHGTGCTHKIENVDEFEAVPEVEIAESF